MHAVGVSLSHRFHIEFSSIRSSLRYTAFIAVLLAMQPIAHGQTIRDWTGGGSNDSYTSVLNWSSLNVPNTASEIARFDLASGFDVTLQSGFGLVVNGLSILAGDINFAATGSVSAFYTLDDDLTVDGGNFTLSNSGGIGNVTMTVSDEVYVGPDSLLTLGTGGKINANGNVLIDGGTLNTKLSSGSTFRLGANQTLTASNSGIVTFDSDVLFPANTTWQFQSGAQFISGAVEIEETAAFTATDSTVSTAAATVSGDAVLEGPTADWTNAGSMEVAGSGHLQINSGSDVSSDSVILNGSAAGTPFETVSRATVDGKDSTWTISQNLAVGDREGATLTITNGGHVSSQESNVGAFGAVSPAFPLSEVSVDGLDSIWDTNALVIVGGVQSAIVSVTNAAQASTGRAILGGPGTWIVEGEDSQWINNGSLFISSLNRSGILPCAECVGGLRIRGGGFVSTDTLNATRDFLFPDAQAFDAPVIVDGPESKLVVTTLATFGGEPSMNTERPGAGYLEITAGGRATTNTAVLGIVDGALGQALVSGSGSVWENTGNLYVGGNEATAGGTGEVTLADQGLLEIGGSLTVWTDGKIMLQGGRLKFDSLQATVDGQIEYQAGTLQLTDAAGYTVGSGTAVIENLLGGDDMVLLRNQSLVVDQQLTIPAAKSMTSLGAALEASTIVNSGLLNAQDTMITTQTGFANESDLVLIDATLNGPLTNAANAAVTVLGSVDFNGLVSGPGNYFGPGTANFNGGLAIGASPAEVAFEGDVSLAAGNSLFIELGGLVAGAEFDRLNIHGLAILDGTLDVTLIDGFIPEIGDSFGFLFANSGFGGMFDTLSLPDIGPGKEWLLNPGGSTVFLEVRAAFSADFDLDGDVDENDLVKWHGDYGDDLDGSHFLDWQRQFGSGVTTLGAPVAVPETSSLLLAVFGLFYLSVERRRKQNLY